MRNQTRFIKLGKDKRLIRDLLIMMSVLTNNDVIEDDKRIKIIMRL